MKKSLIFGISLVLIVLMASGVFAGWFGLTGNALKTGERITEDSSLIVKGIEDNKVRIGNDIYSQGETFTDSGKTYEVKAIEKKAWFFGSDKVVIEEVEPVVEESCGDGTCVPGREVDLAPLEMVERIWVGKTYVIGLGIPTSTSATISVNGVQKEVVVGTSEIINGLPIYLDDAGEDGAEIYYGENEQTCLEDCEGGEEPVPIEIEVTYEGVLKMLGNCKAFEMGTAEPQQQRWW